jgi:hypothetical protein
MNVPGNTLSNLMHSVAFGSFERTSSLSGCGAKPGIRHSPVRTHHRIMLCWSLCHDEFAFKEASRGALPRTVTMGLNAG